MKSKSTQKHETPGRIGSEMKQTTRTARTQDRELQAIFNELSRCASPFLSLLYDVALMLAAQWEHDGHAGNPTERQATEYLHDIWHDAVSESHHLSDALRQVADLLVREREIREFFRKNAQQLEIGPTMVSTDYILSRAASIRATISNQLPSAQTHAREILKSKAQ